MRRLFLLIATFLLVAGPADAAVRNANSKSRATPMARAPQSRTTGNTSARTSKQTTARTTSPKAISRAATTARATANNASVSARPVGGAPISRAATIARTASAPTTRRSVASNLSTARATTSMSATDSSTFGTGYNTCRDAYFTCMDQFCATANDTYRRCICSSKLPEIQSREQALSDASYQLQEFKNTNMSVIDKTAAEVAAMTSASVGEQKQSVTTDKSASASALSGISEVLNQAKNQSLSTQGTLDIAGNINQIWSTTSLTGGTNISNLTGEALYNAVNAQCAELTIDKCPNSSIQKMVISAYGMYIENDCSLLINTLDQRLSAANGTIRDTEREMQLARLENYNAHNSTSIHDCIAQVRADITADTACGTDYVHCLDITGIYLNYDTGEPIYSPNFYQLESQISLSGDILTNQTNRLLISALNSKRDFATRGLDTCRDISDIVWDEFLRQAVTEIYQGQQERIRLVKNECLDVVNACYDTEANALKDFSNVNEHLLLGSRLELSEQLCREKLDACSNLYGGGTHGMTELIAAMNSITDSKIAGQCQSALRDYAKSICAVPSYDTLHTYPYACRVYAPGEFFYAKKHMCNTYTYQGKIATSHETDADYTAPYTCDVRKIYTSCAAGNYLSGGNCYACPDDCDCPAGSTYESLSPNCPSIALIDDCGTDYIGSLYHQLARYAMQACVRPSESNNPLPNSVLQDLNIVMDEIRTDMSRVLASECEGLGGVWNTDQWIDTKETIIGLRENCESTNCNYETFKGNYTDGFHDITDKGLLLKFYTETASNPKWGYCSAPTNMANIQIIFDANYLDESNKQCTPDANTIQPVRNTTTENPTFPATVMVPTAQSQNTAKCGFCGYYKDGVKYYDKFGEAVTQNLPTSLPGSITLTAKYSLSFDENTAEPICADD